MSEKLDTHRQKYESRHRPYILQKKFKWIIDLNAKHKTKTARR